MSEKPTRPGIGRIIARTLTLCAVTQTVFGLYLLTSAALNYREAHRVMEEQKSK